VIASSIVISSKVVSIDRQTDMATLAVVEKRIINTVAATGYVCVPLIIVHLHVATINHATYRDVF
jgi:hypothetical protein